MKRIGFALNPTSDDAAELRDHGLAWCEANDTELTQGDLLSVATVAQYCGRSRATVRNWFWLGSLVPVRINGRCYVTVSELLQFLKYHDVSRGA